MAVLRKIDTYLKNVQIRHQNLHFLHASFEQHRGQKRMPHSKQQSALYFRSTGMPTLHVRPLVSDPFGRLVKGFCFIVIEMKIKK